MGRRASNAVAQHAVTDEMVEAIAQFYDDPLGFVLFAYPWGEEGSELEKEAGPDAWQVEALESIGRQVRERIVTPDLGAILEATASGHGIGKSALVCWVVQWFMSTRTDAVVVVTANTANQLTTKTWRELAKWHRLMINGSWFQWTATTFYHKERPETWKGTAIPWSKERAEAFAGTHAAHVLMLFDEASGIDDMIWEVAEGALTTAGAMWLVFGNPTRNTGRFRECFRRFRHRWTVRQVDSRKAKKANKGQIQSWIDDYGEDSDFVRVRVRGEFPRSSYSQFIGTDLVEDAQRRFKAQYAATASRVLRDGVPSDGLNVRIGDNPNAPLILAVDVARKGDDQSVVLVRHGRVALVLAKYRELDTVQLSYRVLEWMQAVAPDAVFVDEVGVGAGVLDTLNDLNAEVIGTNNGLKAIEDRRFFNRRAETWWKMRDWLKDGGCIPHDDRELGDDLTSPEYGFSDRGEKVQLESKDDMRARGLPSPDTADALAMTFWMPVAAKAGGETVAEKIARLAAGGGGGGATSWMSY